ncbi:MAG: 3-deoxy-manno-octulosonate cytidylyltransferase [Crocinitomicaceae bacterium]
MKVLGIIPARFASSRFPGKPLIDLAGKSMIQRVYEQASLSALLNDVVVATDDERIVSHIESFGGKVVMTGDHHRSGTERCGEVIESYSDYDVVINIQGDEPLVQPKQLERVIELFDDPKVQIGTLVKVMNNPADIRNPNRIKVVLDNEKNGIYFSRSPIPHIAQTAHEKWMDKGPFYKHIGIYAWRMEVLKEIINLPATLLEKQESLEQLRWLYHGYQIRTAETKIETPNIDTPEDVDAVMALLR